MQQPKRVVTIENIDARGNLILIPDEGLEAMGIDDACEISKNAQEHHDWPVHSIPEKEGMDNNLCLRWRGC